MAKWPKGIRPSGKGIRVTVWRDGETVYDKTHPGNPYSAADLKAAEDFRNDMVSRIKLGLPLFADDVAQRRIFVDVAQSFLNAVPVDATTRVTYKSYLNKHCLPTLGNHIIEEITRQNIVDLVGSWSLSVASKRQVLTVLHSVFKYAGINPNPAAKVPVGREKKKKLERYKPKERDAILNALDGAAKVYYAIFFGCGMRSGEILALEWADYDGEYLEVSKQYTRGKFKDHTKTKEDRRVFVPSWVRPIINDHDTRLAGKRLFEDVRAQTYIDAWDEAHEKARIGAHRIRRRRPYTCRHTRAAELLSNDVPPAQAAYELGHSPAMFLKTYAEFIEEFCSDRDTSRLEGIKFAPGSREKVSKTLT